MRPIVAGALLLTAFAAGCSSAQQGVTVQNAQQQGDTELLVQLRPDSPAGDVAIAVAEADALVAETVVRESQQLAGRGEVLLVRVPAGSDVDEARARLTANPRVAFVEPNFVYTTQQLANDSHYADGSLWGMYGDDKPAPIGPIGPNPPGTLTTSIYGIQAEKAWRAGHVGDAAVVVAVMDEGIDVTHPDLKDNLWMNPGETGTDSAGVDKRVNKKDDDGNGKVDDVYGWDFRNNDNTVFDGTTSDPVVDRHGTHVAGTIAARGGNAAGVAGVVWNGRVIAAKFIGPTGGTTADAIKAIDYLIDLKKRHSLNLVAVNHSWGGSGKSVLLHDALKRAARAGILSICAAGNGSANNDAAAFYPASYDTTADWRPDGGTAGESYDAIVAVASIEQNGALAASSNYGRIGVDLAAPGGAIMSTMPRGRYGKLSGTSMAAPHVTGATTLYAAVRPTATPPAIKAAILASAVATPTNSVKTKTVTEGRLNVSGF